jgi:hypothetical protein
MLFKFPLESTTLLLVSSVTYMIDKMIQTIHLESSANLTNMTFFDNIHGKLFKVCPDYGMVNLA